MRLAVLALLLSALSFGVFARTTEQSYWLLLKNDGLTWCGYTNQAEFESEANILEPAESARVSYSSRKLTKVTFQVEPESGDWVVVDEYMPFDDGISLHRANLLTQPNLEVLQDAMIRSGKAEPFRVISVTTLHGGKVQRSDITPLPALPKVAIWTSFAAMPFVSVVTKMRSGSLTTLCEREKE